MANRQQQLTSIFETVGDFRVSERSLDAAEEQMGERTARSQRQDRSRRVPVTTDYEKWESDTDHWDYPGVDTPREDPRVLPKDLMQSEKPRTTDPNTGGDPSAKVAPIGSKERAFAEFETRASGEDVSLSPSEGIRGVGAVDPQSLGGIGPGHGEAAPRNKLAEPPDITSPGPVPDAPQDDKGFFYEKVRDKTSPEEFKQSVREKEREMGGLANEFAAAGLVASELRDD